MSEWIRVEDKLPDSFQNVVFRYAGWNAMEDCSGYRTEIGYYRHAFKMDGSDREYKTATHWFPLPPDPNTMNTEDAG